MKQNRLATLGSCNGTLTCSMNAARELGTSEYILPCPSFEDAREMVIRNEADAFLAPAAYPHLNSFIMDDRIEVAYSTVLKIPDLVLLTSGCEGDDCDTLYYHPATAALLSETAMRFQSVETAASNEEACLRMMASQTPSACITNALCSSHFGVPVRKVLRSAISMPWIVFRRKQPSEQPLNSSGRILEAA